MWKKFRRVQVSITSPCPDFYLLGFGITSYTSVLLAKACRGTVAITFPCRDDLPCTREKRRFALESVYRTIHKHYTWKRSLIHLKYRHGTTSVWTAVRTSIAIVYMRDCMRGAYSKCALWSTVLFSGWKNLFTPIYTLR